MLVRIIDLNCQEKEYKFDISNLTEHDWKTFAHTVVMDYGEFVKDLTLNGMKVVIRDNKAKVKLFYQDSTYHELQYRLDEFGRISKNYKDIVSTVWQNIMKKRFGQTYETDLNQKFSTIENEVNQ